MRRFFLLLAVLLALLIPAESVAGPFTVLPKRGSAWSKTWLTGWDHRKEFTVSRASGAVANYQLPLYIGASDSGFGEKASITKCEDTTGWSGSRANVGTAAGYEGTNAVTITATSDDGYASFTFTAQSWTNTRTISLWHKRTGTETTGQLLIFDGSGNYVGWSFSMSDDWTRLIIDTTSAPDDSGGTIDWTAVTTVRLDANASGTVLLVDDIKRGVNTDMGCSAHAEADFKDLRFTKGDATTVLPYYIEEITGTTPDIVAKVYAKLDSVGTSATSFYMYYGNSGATAASSGADTFIFFDDFNTLTDGQLSGQNSWGGDTDFVVETAVKYEGAKAVGIAGATNKKVTQAIAISGFNVWIQAMMYSNVASEADKSQFSIMEGASYKTGINISQGYVKDLIPGTWQNVIAAADTTWYKTRIALDAASTHKVWVNDVLMAPASNANYENVSSAVDTLWLMQSTSTANTRYFDQIIVGQYLAVEPVIGSFGAEESK